MRQAEESRHAERKLTGRSRARLAALVCALFAAGAGVALGCGWNGFENSVRFNFWTSEREMTRLPPLPYRLGPKDARPADDDDEYVTSLRVAAEANALWRRAEEAVRGGDLRGAARLLREFVELAGDDARANSAVDQLDALSALDAGSSAEDVRAYLDARRAFDSSAPSAEASVDEGGATAESAAVAVHNPSPSDPLDELLRGPSRDPRLADNCAYLRAAVLYGEGQAAASSSAFRELVARHPRSEKREAALYMAARAALSQTRAWAGPNAASEPPCPDCRDEHWQAAHEGFSRVVKDYPRGRLVGEARGWLAFLAWRVADRPAALAEYYRMLADEADAGARAEALMSLRLVRGHAGESDMGRVEELLEDEPRAALAYAYHDIYNYTLSYYFNVPGLDPSEPYARCFDPYSDCKEWERDQAATVSRRAERTGLARVARFATRMMNRHPGAHAGAAFMVRVAQANLELGEAEAAHGLARLALATGVAGAERAGALWVKAVAEYERPELDAARRTLAQLVKEFPGGDVEARARRLLALASEDAGDLDAALEQYLALSYEADVAYFLDVLMTPDQLAAFVQRRPAHPRADELLYALGVRYLRAGRYRQARETLTRVRTTATEAPNYYADYYGYDRAPEDPKYKIRSYFFDGEAEWLDGGVAVGRRESGVYAAWVLRDLKTAADLERLTAAAERAGGSEAKAEALYQLASYLYEGSYLKFYNPSAWRGMRAEMLYSLDETRYRAPGEAETVWQHTREHESLSRALDLYLEIADRYRGTRAAPDALYTAVLCHQRLSQFNAYWRRAYEELGLHAGARVVTLADLRRAYPRYRPPADGLWEPSTRTVNGSPAWPAPPAPKKLTGTERARLRLRRAEALAVKGWALAGEVAGGRVRRWTLALLCALAAAALWRATRRSRATLYELLRAAAARRKRHHAALARPASSYAAHDQSAPAARLRDAAADVGRTLLGLLLDERGRAALAVNLLTHGLLTALLWALARALHS